MCRKNIRKSYISNECDNELKLNKIVILELIEKFTEINSVKDSKIENRIFNKRRRR